MRRRVASYTEPDSAMRTRVSVFRLAGIVLLLLLFYTIAGGRLPFEHQLIGFTRYDRAIQTGAVHASSRDLDHSLRLSLTILEFLLLLLAVAGAFGKTRIERWLNLRVFSLSVTVASACTLFVFLSRLGVEAEWYPLAVLMTNPATLPIFGHRLLLVWPADALKYLVPRLSYLQCYYATQIVAIFLAVITIGEWSAIFIGGRLKFIGQLLLVAMLGPTFYYFTFYDIAMVFFFAWSLLLLYRGKYALFVLVLGLGTLNHENTLLLVPLAAFVLWREKPPKIAMGVPCAGLGAYILARLAMQWAMPMHTLFYFRVWTNILELAHPSRGLVQSALSLVFWWACAGIALPHAEPFLQRAAILFPLLLIVTILFGQFHEARQFDAFIPVAIALILSLVRKVLANYMR
ncbi:MAG TPA: hypothetical protein VN788_05315, partial [Verrucomicrobiae bacterium]|nr:hypothetical protein [Verrucomicrobiae bacterium]